MLDLIWLIPLLPFIGFLVNVLVIARLPDAANRERLAGYIASGAVGAAAVVALLATFALAGLPEEARHAHTALWTWIATGDLNVTFGLWFDPLSAVMVLLVTIVGTLIHIYSIGYMHGDTRVVRYFAYLNLFIVMMLFLVMGDNLLLLFLGWEGVGLCSFLLIGYWYEKQSASNAAVKAFVVNRIGDAGMLLAIMAVFFGFGTVTFYDIEVGGQTLPGFVENAGAIAGQQFGIFGFNVFLSTIIGLLLLLGVTGKSAQLPLFVWLPDAMAGPTPVSALIHAATMVTAGVYLMARTHTIFQLDGGGVQTWVVWVGALTAIMAATVAVTQWDIKRVLAFSTVSQLGFMVAAAGMGIYVAAIFHLLTHGIFKALLFLGSGSVIHGTHETQDMRNMGGLRSDMPTTFRTYVIGALALSGIVPFAGFWSKDEILAHALEYRDAGLLPIFIILLVASVLTAFYMGRQLALVFWGEQRDPHYHAHESPAVMTVPLIILAGGAVLAGAMNLPFEGLRFLHDWLHPVFPDEGVTAFNPPLAVGATLLAAGSLALGWYSYARNFTRKIKVGGKDPLYPFTGDLWEMAYEGWGLDNFYRKVVVPAYRDSAGYLARVFDPQGIDGVVNGVGTLMQHAANSVRAIQTGYVRNYALMFLLGVVLILAFLMTAVLVTAGN